MTGHELSLSQSRLDEPGRSLVSHIDSYLKIEKASYRRNYALSLIGPLVAAFGDVLVEFLRPTRTVWIWYRLWSWALLAFDPVKDRCENLRVPKEKVSSLVKNTLNTSGKSQEVGGPALNSIEHGTSREGDNAKGATAYLPCDIQLVITNKVAFVTL